MTLSDNKNKIVNENTIINSTDIVNSWSVIRKTKCYKKRKTIYKDSKDLYIQINNTLLKYPPKSGVILFRNNFTEVLLVTNNYGNIDTNKWGFPKGHLEKNETYIIGGHREFYEETGLYINPDNFNYKFIKINNSRYYPYYINNPLINLQPIDKNEICDVKFLKINNLSEKNLNKESFLTLKNKFNSCILKAKEIEFNDYL
jgi:8-oxo-dGTP pyrophosphatase MutT (NUDIX family)